MLDREEVLMNLCFASLLVVGGMAWVQVVDEVIWMVVMCVLVRLNVEIAIVFVDSLSHLRARPHRRLSVTGIVHAVGFLTETALLHSLL